MAPSSGHLLLPKVWRAARFAYEKASKAIRARIQDPLPQTHLEYQPAYARLTRQPINRVAAIRQARSRHFSTRATAAAFSSKPAARFGATASRISQIGSTIKASTFRAPFASALRPNLTGGALGRTAGGYTVGAGRIGGQRYFSSSPAAPAQVVNNVSAAVRAFWLSGQRARFDGVDPKTGEKRYRAVSTLHEDAGRKMQSVPRNASGSYIDFQLSPTITAFGALGSAQGFKSAGDCQPTLTSEGLMDLLSVDFARSLKDLAAITNDLKRLATLGDLPFELHDKSTLRVRFPGCDAETVERLCDEVGVQRGQVYQDEDFEILNGADIALSFPFAPSHAPSPEEELFFFSRPEEVDWRQMLSSNKSSSLRPPDTGSEYAHVSPPVEENPWASISGYSSLEVSELGDRAFFPALSEVSASAKMSLSANLSAGYDGFEGIYRFLGECERAQR